MQQLLRNGALDEATLSMVCEDLTGPAAPMAQIAEQDKAYATVMRKAWPLTADFEPAFKQAASSASLYRCAWPKAHWRLDEARWTPDSPESSSLPLSSASSSSSSSSAAAASASSVSEHKIVTEPVAVFPFTLSDLNNTGQPNVSSPASMLALACTIITDAPGAQPAETPSQAPAAAAAKHDDGSEALASSIAEAAADPLAGGLPCPPEPAVTDKSLPDTGGSVPKPHVVAVHKHSRHSRQNSGKRQAKSRKNDSLNSTTSTVSVVSTASSLSASAPQAPKPLTHVGPRPAGAIATHAVSGLAQHEAENEAGASSSSSSSSSSSATATAAKAMVLAPADAGAVSIVPAPDAVKAVPTGDYAGAQIVSAVSKPFVMASCNTLSRPLRCLTNKKLALMPTAPIPSAKVLKNAISIAKTTLEAVEMARASRGASPEAEQSLLARAETAVIPRAEAIRLADLFLHDESRTFGFSASSFAGLPAADRPVRVSLRQSARQAAAAISATAAEESKFMDEELAEALLAGPVRRTSKPVRVPAGGAAAAVAVAVVGMPEDDTHPSGKRCKLRAGGNAPQDAAPSAGQVRHATAQLAGMPAVATTSSLHGLFGQGHHPQLLAASLPPGSSAWAPQPAATGYTAGAPQSFGPAAGAMLDRRGGMGSGAFMPQHTLNAAMLSQSQPVAMYQQLAGMHPLHLSQFNAPQAAEAAAAPGLPQMLPHPHAHAQPMQLSQAQVNMLAMFQQQQHAQQLQMQQAQLHMAQAAAAAAGFNQFGAYHQMAAPPTPMAAAPFSQAPAAQFLAPPTPYPPAPYP
jgi:hypothetical protein